MIADKGCTNDKFFGEYVPHTLRSIGAKKPFNQVNLRLVVMGRGTNLDTVAANDSNLQKIDKICVEKQRGWWRPLDLTDLHAVVESRAQTVWST